MNRTDEEIKTEIVNRINWDTRVDASDVLVEVKNGAVSLTGTVPNSGARRAAYERAKEVRGGSVVDNQLVVAYLSQEALPDDETIKEMVQNALDWHADIDTDLITVMVDLGVVELNGTVQWYWQSQKAKDLVSDLKGVISVNNRLRVLPTKKVNDDTIAGEITYELGRFGNMESDKVTVTVKDGIVTLSGIASSYVFEKRAYETAVHTAGVKGIINEIQVLVM